MSVLAPAPQPQLAEADPADNEPPGHHGQRHDGWHHGQRHDGEHPVQQPPQSHPPRARMHTAEKMSSNCQLSPSAAASGGCSECWRWLQRSAPPHPDHQTSSPAGRHLGCTSQTAPASIASLSVLLANKRYNIFALLTAYQWQLTRDVEVAAAKPRGGHLSLA